jgi:CheY-like chemotaxis protein
VAVETIERSTRAQAKLIDEILDVSRIVTGKLQLAVVPVNIRAVVEAALEAIRPSITAKGIELHVAFDEIPTPPLGDAARLQQVIWNLLSNSVKFTPSGGAIYVGLDQSSPTTLTISVRDSGCGIPRRFLPHIFERFRQADSSSTRTHGGLGLGLAIVKNIVELHGGSVLAESEGEGKGSTFKIMLPVVPGPVAAASPVAEASAPLALSGISVLLVEDEDDTRYMLSQALQSFGASVTAVRSAAAAIEAMHTSAPTVVVSDIGMPDEDGYSLMLKIRSGVIERLKDVPAIALTGYARPEDRDQVLAAGYGFHIAKPVDPIVVVRTVREAAGR